MANLLCRAAALWPNHDAIIHGQRRCTWGELDELSSAVARGFADMGLIPGSRVLVMAPNGIELLVSLWAVWRSGLVWVPLHQKLSPREVSYAAVYSGAAAFFHDPKFTAHAIAAAEEAPSLQHIVPMPPGSFDALRGTMPYVPPVDVTPESCCWMFFTSGSTGRPKGAMFGHAQLMAVVQSFMADVVPALGPDDALLVCAPLTHGAGVQMLPNVAAGAPCVITESSTLDPQEVWQLVEQHRVTNMFTVPTILKMLVEHPTVDTRDHSSLRYVTYSGSPMYREDQKRALKKLGRVLIQLYGLAEVTAGITVLPGSLHDENDAVHPVGSCGFARTGMDISVRDESGSDLPRGQSGEIWVRGPNVFLGYYEQEDANKQSFLDGWFKTGDVGYMDTRGLLYISGRTSDMFISGGQNIYPREIEEVLLTHPAVGEVAVVGIPHTKWGEIGVAAVVPARDKEFPDDEDLLNFLNDKLAKYKWPRHVVLVDDLPLSAYGKVAKAQLRDLVLSRLTHD